MSIAGVYFLFCSDGKEKRFAINGDNRIVQFKAQKLQQSELGFIKEYFGI